MKKYLLAIALTVALPAMAHAQTATAAPKTSCCKKTNNMACCKDGKMDCCNGMTMRDRSTHGMKAGADSHAGHDMSKPMAKSPPATATPSN